MPRMVQYEDIQTRQRARNSSSDTIVSKNCELYLSRLQNNPSVLKASQFIGECAKTTETANKYFDQIYELAQQYPGQLDSVIESTILPKLSHVTEAQLNKFPQVWAEQVEINRLCDRIIDNHDSLQRQAKLPFDKYNAINSPETLMEICCKGVENEKMVTRGKILVALEEFFYQANSRGIKYDDQKMIERARDYFLLKEGVSSVNMEMLDTSLNRSRTFCYQGPSVHSNVYNWIIKNQSDATMSDLSDEIMKKETLDFHEVDEMFNAVKDFYGRHTDAVKIFGENLINQFMEYHGNTPNAAIDAANLESTVKGFMETRLDRTSDSALYQAIKEYVYDPIHEFNEYVYPYEIAKINEEYVPVNELKVTDIIAGGAIAAGIGSVINKAVSALGVAKDKVFGIVGKNARHRKAKKMARKILRRYKISRIFEDAVLEYVEQNDGHFDIALETWEFDNVDDEIINDFQDYIKEANEQLKGEFFALYQESTNTEVTVRMVSLDDNVKLVREDDIEYPEDFDEEVEEPISECDFKIFTDDFVYSELSENVKAYEALDEISIGGRKKSKDPKFKAIAGGVIDDLESKVKGYLKGNVKDSGKDQFQLRVTTKKSLTKEDVKAIGKIVKDGNQTLKTKYHSKVKVGFHSTRATIKFNVVVKEDAIPWKNPGEDHLIDHYIYESFDYDPAQDYALEQLYEMKQFELLSLDRYFNKEDAITYFTTENMDPEMFKCWLEACSIATIDRDTVLEVYENITTPLVGDRYDFYCDTRLAVEAYEPMEDVPTTVALEAMDVIYNIVNNELSNIFINEASNSDDDEDDDEDNDEYDDDEDFDEEEEYRRWEEARNKKKNKKQEKSESNEDKDDSDKKEKEDSKKNKEEEHQDNNKKDLVNSADKMVNNIKLFLMGMKKKVKDLSSKEQEASRNLDTSFNMFARNLKKALVSDRREAIIKGSVIPSFSRCIKAGILLAGSALVNPLAPVIGAIGAFAVSKHLTKKERVLLLDDIEIELEILEKEINIAESRDQTKKMRALMREKKELQRQYQRIKYNMRIGKDLIPGGRAVSVD